MPGVRASDVEDAVGAAPCAIARSTRPRSCADRPATVSRVGAASLQRRRARRRARRTDRPARGPRAGGAAEPRADRPGPPAGRTRRRAGTCAARRCRRACRAAGRRGARPATDRRHAIRRRDRDRCDGSPTASAADLRGRRDVALDQRRRDAEHVGDVVEAGRRIVGRQQRADVDVEREQIADGVRVLGAVQPVQRRRAGIGIGARPRDRAALRARP